MEYRSLETAILAALLQESLRGDLGQRVGVLSVPGPMRGRFIHDGRRGNAVDRGGTDMNEFGPERRARVRHGPGAQEGCGRLGSYTRLNPASTVHDEVAALCSIGDGYEIRNVSTPILHWKGGDFRCPSERSEQDPDRHPVLEHQPVGNTAAQKAARAGDEYRRATAHG